MKLITVMLHDLVLFSVVFAVTLSHCPQDWTPLDSHCYRLFDEKVNYSAAELKCKTNGANLIVIKSEIQNQLVANLLFNHWARGIDVWLGVRKIIHSDNPNQWVWNDFSEAKYFNWAPSQPNSNGAQYCMEMVRQYRIAYNWTAGTWNDISCDELNSVICQRPSMSGISVQSLSPSSPVTDIDHQFILVMVCLIVLTCIMVYSVIYVLRKYYLNLNFCIERQKRSFGFLILKDENDPDYTKMTDQDKNVNPITFL